MYSTMEKAGRWYILVGTIYATVTGHEYLSFDTQRDADKCAEAMNYAHGTGYAKRGADIREALGV